MVQALVSACNESLIILVQSACCSLGNKGTRAAAASTGKSFSKFAVASCWTIGVAVAEPFGALALGAHARAGVK